MQRIDVTSGIESALTMLAHKLRDGVTVVREYGAGVPEIEAYAGELNQVWTNLIDNAIDAMEGRGTLRISTRAVADNVEIDIADNGPGMSAEVAARALEAFYTTKDVGKGTGLGLDIARRIIMERHGGTSPSHRGRARPCCGSAYLRALGAPRAELLTATVPRGLQGDPSARGRPAGTSPGR
jgi:signal transduction histidine kinase